MTDFKVQLSWIRKTPDFDPKTYDRTHTVKLSGGFSYSASAAPDYHGRADLPNPEEGLLAALASCHMLTFLAIAANSKLEVNSYDDTCVAKLERNDKGKMCIKNVLLQPRVTFTDDTTPNLEKLKQLHEKAHANCIVANSITSKVSIEPIVGDAP